MNRLFSLVIDRTAVLAISLAVVLCCLSRDIVLAYRLPADGPAVVFGNSIAEGYIDGDVDTVGRYSNLLRDELSNLGYDVEVVNAGRGGDTSRDGYDRLDSDVLRFEPQVVTISFGPNDYYITGDGRPRVEVGEFSLYLRAIVERVNNASAQPILLSLVPVIPDLFYNSHNRALYEPLGGIETLWQAYDNAVRQVASEEGVDVVDLFAAFNDSLEMLLGEDGGHPNRRGHRTIANVLLPHVVNGLEAAGSNGESGSQNGEGIHDVRVFPNPFKPEEERLVRIFFKTVSDGRVTIEVYDLSGRRVSTPVQNTFRVAGDNTEFWDGKSDRGERLASGVYLVRTSFFPISGGRSSHKVKKVAIVR